MIDDVVRARVHARCFVVRVARGRNDLCAGTASPLNSVIADTAGTTHDQQGLVLDLAVGEHGTVRRHGRNAEARPGVVARLLRQARREVAAYRDILRGGPEAALVLSLVYPDPLTLSALVDAFANRLDNARTIAIGYHEACIQQAGKRTCTFLDVRWIDGAGVEAYEHLARVGARSVDVAELQDLPGCAELAVQGRAHVLPLPPGPDYRGSASGIVTARAALTSAWTLFSSWKKRMTLMPLITLLNFFM